MNFDIIAQVRLKSTRLPAKVLLKFNNENFLSLFLKNMKKVGSVRKIIIACPDDEYKELFKFFAKKTGVNFFFLKGDENNVLKRYYYCAKKYSSKNIIRITSDCPFINPIIVNKMIKHYQINNLDFLTNNKPRFIPHGFDCEIISFRLLQKTFKVAKNKFQKEHVTPWIYQHYYKDINYLKIFESNYSKKKLTLDTPLDYLYFLKNEKILNKISHQTNFEQYLKKL